MKLTTYLSDSRQVALKYNRDEVPASGQEHPPCVLCQSHPGSAPQLGPTAPLLVNERRVPTAGRKWLADGRWARDS